MDVNGTRFHLVLGPADWRGGDDLPAGLGWNAAEGAVELARLPFVFPPRREEAPPGLDARRGAGRDRFGNWYWIDEEARGLLARAPRDNAPRAFWPAQGPPRPLPTGEFAPEAPADEVAERPLQGLVVTSEHYLLVGSLDPAGLLVFDLAAGGPPLALDWPADVPFAPWDMAPSPDGGAWILDRQNARLWSLDRLFRVRIATPPVPPGTPTPDFVPAEPPAAAPAPPASVPAAGPVTIDAALDVSAVPGLAGVEGLCDGTVLVLGTDADDEAPELYHYALEGEVDTYPVGPLMAPYPDAAEQLPYAHDLAFVPDPDCEAESIAGTVFLAAPNGNQAFAFRVTTGAAGLRLAFSEAFYPMRRFGGRALVSAGEEAHYDSGERWVSLLKQPRPRYETDALLTVPPPPPEGGTGAFDGRTPGCVWHRLFLDACIPPGASVSVESRAADNLPELVSQAWVKEPDPYLRGHGPELPWARSRAPRDTAGAGTWELLFQAARGQYLQVRLGLQGNGRTTPRLYALRVHYPRFSYLREYLPAVWREDPGSSTFVDRFLANVEGTFTELEGRIASAQILFDTRTAPAEFLDWLAGWVGASLDAAWDERKRRFFVANALRMYAGRGTRDGIVRALRLALEDCPDPDLFERRQTPSPRFAVRITERFLARSAPGVAYGEVGTPGVPAAVVPGQGWSPAHGAAPLHERWRAWLADRFQDVAGLNQAWGTDYESLDDPATRLPATEPAGAAAADWRRFIREGLTFTYESPGSSDLPLWAEFLGRRYAQPDDLNRAWGLHGDARVDRIEDVGFPDEIPGGGAELTDWITFVSVMLPMRRGAHRFTVLVPVRLEEPPHEQRARRDLADRIAALEKPAHAVVRTRLYWAAFQVGNARLGTDSVLGLGSRFSTLVLGRGELAGAHLGWTEPWNVRGRRVVGRDPVAVRSSISGLSERCK